MTSDGRTDARASGSDDMRARVLAGILILAASGGCTTVKETLKESLKTTPDTIERPASDTPDQFLRQDGQPNVSTACLNPLVDPRDKTRVQMVRSASGQADYRAPAGKYGLDGNELLRIDCTTGRAVGVVRAE